MPVDVKDACGADSHFKRHFALAETHPEDRCAKVVPTPTTLEFELIDAADIPAGGGEPQAAVRPCRDVVWRQERPFTIRREGIFRDGPPRRDATDLVALELGEPEVATAGPCPPYSIPSQSARCRKAFRPRRCRPPQRGAQWRDCRYRRRGRPRWRRSLRRGLRPRPPK